MLKKIIKRIMRLCKFVLKKINKPIYITKWYQNLFVNTDNEIYPNNTWYRKHEERNFDLINLGSSGAKWAFDYSNFNIKAMNWAQQPQTLLADFNLLRNFHSILRNKGYVLITIMPFTSLNKETDIFDTMKYLKVGAHESILNKELRKARLYELIPLLMGKPAIKAILKHILNKKNNYDPSSKYLLHKNMMSANELERDALRWINGWKNQFSINDFEAPLTPKNQEGREYRIILMQKIIDFCIERSYIPVYVISPVTSYLSKYFTEKFMNIYIYKFLKDVNRNIKLLDYSKDQTLTNSDLYFNSFFFNKKGANVFTEKVLKDLNLF